MNKVERYWIIEGVLIVIAISGLGIAAYNTFASAEGNSPAANTTVAVAGEEPPAVIEPTPSELILVDLGNDDGDTETFQAGADEPEEPFDEDESSVELDELDEMEPDDEDAEAEIDEDEEDIEFGDRIGVAAQVIGISPEAIEAALDSGQSFADLAAANGVDVQPLVDAFVADELKLIEAELAAGEITRQEAREWLGEAQPWIAFEVHHPYTSPEKIAADLLGVDIEVIYEAVESGQTLRTLAEENGVDPQTLIDAIVQSEITHMELAVQAGLIVDEEMTYRLEEIPLEVEEFVNSQPEWLDENEGDEDGEAPDEEEEERG